MKKTLLLSILAAGLLSGTAVFAMDKQPAPQGFEKGPGKDFRDMPFDQKKAMLKKRLTESLQCVDNAKTNADLRKCKQKHPPKMKGGERPPKGGDDRKCGGERPPMPPQGEDL